MTKEQIKGRQGIGEGGLGDGGERLLLFSAL